jgi:hypothetical protein
MDGKPRLIQVQCAANWLVQTYLLRGQIPSRPQPLLQRCITQAWELAGKNVPPWTNIELHH